MYLRVSPESWVFGVGWWVGGGRGGDGYGLKAYSTGIVTAIKYKNTLVWLLLFAGIFLVSRVHFCPKSEAMYVTF